LLAFPARAMPQPVPPASKMPQGIYIESVVVGWPAHRAGLETGDVITKINGNEVANEREFLQAVRDAAEQNTEIIFKVIKGRTGGEVERRLRPSTVDGKVGIYEYRVGPLPAAGGGRREKAERLTQEALRRHVERLARSGEIKLPEPTFSAEDDMLWYNLKPIAFSEDPYDLVISAQVTASAIRAYRLREPEQREFWLPVLDRVEDEIARMLKDIEAGGSGKQQSERIERIYQTELNRRARALGMKGAGIKTEVEVIAISVLLNPPEGEVKYMAAGPWMMIWFRTGEEPAWDHTEWKTAPAGGAVRVGQVTRFAARWDDGAKRSATIDIADSQRSSELEIGKRGVRWKPSKVRGV
jgi:hypothetical protein